MATLAQYRTDTGLYIHSKENVPSTLFDKAWAVAGITVAIAAGVTGLILSASEEEAEMDTTTRLLSGGNKDRILAALDRYEKGEYIAHGLIEV